MWLLVNELGYDKIVLKLRSIIIMIIIIETRSKFNLNDRILNLGRCLPIIFSFANHKLKFDKCRFNEVLSY